MEEFRSSESANDLGAESASYVRSVCPHEITEEVASGEALVIDVREPEEWQKEHIPGAINIPHGWLELMADPANPSFDRRIHPGKPIYVHCATGRRSALATAALNGMGYEKAVNLAGGFEEWEGAGYPVERAGESEEKRALLQLKQRAIKRWWSWTCEAASAPDRPGTLWRHSRNYPLEPRWR